LHVFFLLLLLLIISELDLCLMHLIEIHRIFWCVLSVLQLMYLVVCFGKLFMPPAAYVHLLLRGVYVAGNGMSSSFST
jgi:hypothetical protein